MGSLDPPVGWSNMIVAVLTSMATNHGSQPKWPKWIEEMARQLEVKLKLPNQFFNSCNGNRYQGSKENLEYHSDDESMFRKSEFERDVFIASISFGATRNFSILEKYGRTLDPIGLEDGDLLTMSGRMQDDYKHAILQDKFPDPSIRFNLTFRAILRHDTKCIQRQPF